MINTIFNNLALLSSFENLLSEKNLVRNENGVMEFKNNNSKLVLTTSDNGFGVSFESLEENVDDYREDFIKFCDTLDDDLFQDSVDLYAASFGSVSELENNLTKEGIVNFVECVKTSIVTKVEELKECYNNARDYISNL